MASATFYLMRADQQNEKSLNISNRQLYSLFIYSLGALHKINHSILVKIIDRSWAISSSLNFGLTAKTTVFSLVLIFSLHGRSSSSKPIEWYLSWWGVRYIKSVSLVSLAGSVQQQETKEFNAVQQQDPKELNACPILLCFTLKLRCNSNLTAFFLEKWLFTIYFRLLWFDEIFSNRRSVSIMNRKRKFSLLNQNWNILLNFSVKARQYKLNSSSRIKS